MDDFNNNIYANANKIDFIATTIAIIITILVHIGVIYVVPSNFATNTQKDEKNDELQIEILKPLIEKSLPDFIEANPFGNNDKPLSEDAPESFKDQRAADILPDAQSDSKLPYVEGEMAESKKIVQGTSADIDQVSPEQVHKTLERPLVQPAQASEFPEKENQDAKKSDDDAKDDNNENTIYKEDVDTSLSEGQTARKLEEDSNDSMIVDKANIDKIDSSKQKDKVTDLQQKNKKVKSVDGDKTQTKKIEPKKEEETIVELPKPTARPSLSMRIPAGPLADNRTHASTQGMIACDSRFSEFGAYQQRMLEAISRQWNLLASKYNLSNAIGTVVVVEFYLDKTGKLTKFLVEYTNSTNTGKGLCEQSILTTAPYGEWTAEMISTFGSQDQSVKITFYYR